jgi:hypothetical protein
MIIDNTLYIRFAGVGMARCQVLHLDDWVRA